MCTSYHVDKHGIAQAHPHRQQLWTPSSLLPKFNRPRTLVAASSIATSKVPCVTPRTDVSGGGDSTATASASGHPSVLPVDATASPSPSSTGIAGIGEQLPPEVPS